MLQKIKEKNISKVIFHAKKYKKRKKRKTLMYVESHSFEKCKNFFYFFFDLEKVIFLLHKVNIPMLWNDDIRKKFSLFLSTVEPIFLHF